MPHCSRKLVSVFNSSADLQDDLLSLPVCPFLLFSGLFCSIEHTAVSSIFLLRMEMMQAWSRRWQEQSAGMGPRAGGRVHPSEGPWTPFSELLSELG